MNSQIVSVTEFTDVLIESKRLESVLEASQKEMMDMYKHHWKMIKTYMKSAKKKKKGKLYKQCREDLQKALMEVEAMEKTVREMESTMGEAIGSIISQYVAMAMITVLIEGYRIICMNYVGSELSIEDLANAWKKVSKKENEETTIVRGVNKGWAALNVLTVVAGALVQTIKILLNYRKEKKNGAKSADALNQYKNTILKACEQSKKFISTEIKLVQTVIDSDERQVED